MRAAYLTRIDPSASKAVELVGKPNLRKLKHPQSDAVLIILPLDPHKRLPDERWCLKRFISQKHSDMKLVSHHHHRLCFLVYGIAHCEFARIITTEKKR